MKHRDEKVLENPQQNRTLVNSGKTLIAQIYIESEK